MKVSSSNQRQGRVLLQGVLADVSIATGSVTIGLMLTGRFVFQYLGWGVAAAATPLVMAITGSAFFGMSLAAQYGTSLTFGPYSLAAAGVMAGAVTQVTHSSCSSHPNSHNHMLITAPLLNSTSLTLPPVAHPHRGPPAPACDLASEQLSLLY